MKLLLLISFLLVLVVPVAFADFITIQSDKTSYYEGDTIVVSGNVSTVIDDVPFIIQIIHEGIIIETAQITVTQDGSFTETFLAEKPAWKNVGEYTIRAFYQEYISVTQFEFSPKTNTQEMNDDTILIPGSDTSTTNDDGSNEPPTVDDMPSDIPQWVKGIFVYWANGGISDQELTEAIKFLVDSGIIVLE